MLCIQGCHSVRDKFVLEPFIQNNDLIFIVKPNNTIIFSYSVQDLEQMEQGAYKAVWASGEIVKELSEIRIVNFKQKNIYANHAYYLSLGRSGFRNEPGVVLKTFHFCIHQSKVITQSNSESDNLFIQKCHGK